MEPALFGPYPCPLIASKIRPPAIKYTQPLMINTDQQLPITGPSRLMNNRINMFQRRPDQAITKDNQPALKAINAINGIFEPVFTPNPPLVISVAAKRQSYSLNRLVQELCVLLFAFFSRIFYCIGLRLHRVVPIKGSNYQHNNK